MNAIILAAGMGTRLRPLTNNIPKCLVNVCGVPMVEQQIKFLHEAGITDITLVSGYKAEKLAYLKDKYSVDIVFNERYNACNNIYSLYKVLDRFGDSWVIEGDVYMQENCFTKNINQSTYFAKWHDHYENEWGLETDNAGKLLRINIGSGKGYVMSGVSFWTNTAAALLKERIKTLIDAHDYTSLFWDHAALDVMPYLDVWVKQTSYLYEIDSVNELEIAQRISSAN